MDETRELLIRWHGGDNDALAALVERDLTWLSDHVRRHLGPRLRRLNDTHDMIQNAMVEVLRCGPRFVVADRNHFRNLIARMVGNVLCGEHDRLTAAKRDVDREQHLGSGEGIAWLVDDERGRESPSEEASRSELSAMVRLALELLEPEDRRLIVWREYQGESFAEIASRLGQKEDAARMRFQRALPRLAAELTRLRKRDLSSLAISEDLDDRSAR